MEIFPVKAPFSFTKVFLGFLGFSAALLAAQEIFKNYKNNENISKILRERSVEIINKHCEKNFVFDQCLDKKENGVRFIDCIDKSHPTHRFQYFPFQTSQDHKVICTNVDIPFSYEERHIYFNKFSKQEIQDWEAQTEIERRELFWEREEHRQRWEN